MGLELFCAPRKNFLEKKILNDEIVDGVRAVREAHAARFGYNPQAIYEDLKKSEAAHMADGHPFILLPPVPSMLDSALQRARFARK